jgi:hypothetical protein
VPSCRRCGVAKPFCQSSFTLAGSPIESDLRLGSVRQP